MIHSYDVVYQRSLDVEMFFINFRYDQLQEAVECAAVLSLYYPTKVVNTITKQIMAEFPLFEE